MKILFGKSTLVAVAIIALMASFSAQAASGVVIQNAQYNASTGNLYVKGRITGAQVPKVFIVNAETNQFQGTITTKAGGKQFVANLFMTDEASTPCTVKVQVSRRGGFDLLKVRHAPARCDQ